MDVIEAVNKRKSIRSFKPDPVPRKTLTEILNLALRAPSWANTQPWESATVTGKKLQEIIKCFLEKAEEEPNPDLARQAVKGLYEEYLEITAGGLLAC